MKSCPKCGGAMQRGFLLDEAKNRRRQTAWVPGEPVKSIWTGLKVPKGAAIPVVSLRCQRCGFLESYAGEVSGV